MDPVSMIIAALVAGAAKTAGDVAGDAYKGLKGLIQSKFESAGKSKADADYILNKHEQKPEATKELLKDELVEVGVDKDAEIIEKAQELLKQLKPQEAAAGNFNLNIAGDAKNVVQKNDGTINIY
ncbi:MAG TPA: hypothetical protein VK184_13790 [Nostocaceae cyanobacterium]|nr:hypothetical protein [Nostocaceae cyanobacterium]